MYIYIYIYIYILGYLGVPQGRPDEGQLHERDGAPGAPGCS